MPRYQHFLAEASSHSYPRCIICASVDSQGVASNGRTASIREYFNGWTAVKLLMNKGEYVTAEEASGQTEAGWWRYLDAVCCTGAPVWIVSAWCCRVWTLLDLWERIEDGRFRLQRRHDSGEQPGTDAVLLVRGDDGTRPPDSGVAGLPQVQGPGQGILVANDPPNILIGWAGQKDAKVTWVDIRNYGIAPPHGPASGTPMARWLADSATRLVGAIRSFRLGSLRTSAGSQAIHAFRSSYYNGGIWVHNDRHALATEGAGYYGGRCEAYRLGNPGGTARHVDFRGLYTSICAFESIPVRYRCRRVCAGGPGRYDRDALARTIARVTIRTEEPAYPYRKDGIVIWPVGEFVTTLAGPELVDAFDFRRIVEIHDIQEYDCDRALRGYATALYRLRVWAESTADRELSAFAKLAANALPGKFGQRSDGWELRPNVYADSPYGEWIGAGDTGEPCRYRAIAGQVWQHTRGDWTADSCPAIAAFITSHGRMRLLDAIRSAGWENVYYVDTDGLIVSSDGYERLKECGLIRESTLGYLSTKGTYESVNIGGVKYYTADGVLTCAGMPGSGRPNGECNGSQWRGRPVNDYLRGGRKPDCVLELLPYLRSAEYRHGIVGPDGIVRPHRIG